MNKQLIKRILATGAAVALLTPLAAMAAIDTNDLQNVGLGTNTDVKTVVVNIIQFLLGFLAIIAIIIVLYAGFQWMTAAGNEEKITSARGTLTAGLIGLVIILAAYAITSFVINQLLVQVQ